MARFENVDAINRQVRATMNEIDIFKNEVNSDDLERYPNVDERLSQLTVAIRDAADALMDMQSLNVSAEVDLNDIIEATESAIIAVSAKQKEEEAGVLVAALTELLGLQSMLQEVTLGDDSSLRKLRVHKTDTDTQAGG